MTKHDKHHAPGVQWVTLDNGYKVWTQRVGSGPVKLLTLHGGPGGTHEYLECLEDYLTSSNIEVIFYDQLGSYHSNQPDDDSLWQVGRFTAEVEQVRQALDLEDFYLFGHSCGGIWAIEYALQYQAHLKGLVLAGITGSIQSYIGHLNHLRNQLPAELVASMKAFEDKEELGNSTYRALLDQHLYREHLCRLPQWPDGLNRHIEHTNSSVCQVMLGDNEFVVTGNLLGWDRWNELAQVQVATLVLGARYDIVCPDDQRHMASVIPHSRVVICENGSHCAMWDDPDNYRNALLEFFRDVESGRL